MTFPIAAQLPSAMYAPLVVLVVAYAALGILGNRARGREDRARAERYSGIAFALVLVAAVWTLVIFLAAAVGYPSRVYDMIIIILVILAFFALLVVAFFVIVEWIPRTLRRGGDR